MKIRVLSFLLVFLTFAVFADIPASSEYRELNADEVSTYFKFDSSNLETGQEVLIIVNAQGIMCPFGRISGALAISTESGNQIASVSFHDLTSKQLSEQSMYIFQKKEVIYQVSLSYELSLCEQERYEAVIYKFL